MVVGALPGPRERDPLVASLLTDGLAVMRQNLGVYLAFAALCGAAAVYRITLDDIAHDPAGAFLRLPALRVALALGLIALYFIWPAALRRLDEAFHMTFARALVATLTILVVGVATEVGYLAAVIPGIVVGVLLSQALIGVLLRTGPTASPRSLLAAFRASIVSSFAMTRAHFGTTFAVVAFSLLILLVPCAIAIAVLEVSYILEPRSLFATAPLLFVVFIYFECVRYSLIVRWYRHLEENASPAT